MKNPAQGKKFKNNIYDLIAKQKVFYKSIVSLSCPLLNETIYFTSEGFHHLTHKSNNKRRKVNEQYMKLKCLSFAPEIIKNCTRIIETRSEEHLIKGKKKTVITHELVDGKKRSHNIAVIIEKIGTGKHKFRSVKRISSNRYNSKKAP